MRGAAVLILMLAALAEPSFAEQPQQPQQPQQQRRLPPQQPPLRLDPLAIARAFTRHPSVLDLCGLFSLARLDPPELEPNEAAPAADGAEPADEEGAPAGDEAGPGPRAPVVARADWLEARDLGMLGALSFMGRDGGLLGAVSRLQSRLLLGVGAYGSGGGGELYDGLSDSADLAARGRTVRSDDGRLLGDLTLAVGTTAARADVLQWWEGQADLLDLNPFRDISAQFDLAILSERQAPDASVMILRVRGSYVGAFGDAEQAAQSGGAAPEAGDSELGLSFGLKF